MAVRGGSRTLMTWQPIKGLSIRGLSTRVAAYSDCDPNSLTSIILHWLAAAILPPFHGLHTRVLLIRGSEGGTPFRCPSAHTGTVSACLLPVRFHVQHRLQITNQTYYSVAAVLGFYHSNSGSSSSSSNSSEVSHVHGRAGCGGCDASEGVLVGVTGVMTHGSPGGHDGCDDSWESW